MAKVEIDKNSGFCPGVVTAIRKAEEELAKSGSLYCLGDIVHNSNEVERLQSKGLVTITHDDLRRLHGVKVLLRAHGEPPETYRIARENGIEIIDATFEIEEGSFIAIPFDATELLGKDELIDHKDSYSRIIRTAHETRLASAQAAGQSAPVSQQIVDRGGPQV